MPQIFLPSRISKRHAIFRRRLLPLIFKNNAGFATSQVKYRYDAFDRRISKEFDADGDGMFETSQLFVYDGDHIALAFADSDVEGPAPPALTNRYLHNPQVIDQVFADEQFNPALEIGSDGSPNQTAGGNVIYPLADHLGTARDLADYDAALGITAIANHRVYDSYGQRISETNAAVDHAFSFTGRELDEETGQQFNRARYYDSANGRFISEDPIGFNSGITNLASYVANDPTNWSDPFGLEKKGRPPILSDLNASKARDVSIGQISIDVIREMKESGWKPSNPKDDGAFGKEFDRRVAEKTKRLNTPRSSYVWHVDVCIDNGTKKIVKIGAGPGPKGTTQIDALYYKGKLQVGEVLDKSRVEEVYDAKVGRADRVQAERIETLTGKQPKRIPAVEKLTRRGWEPDLAVQKKLGLLQKAGIGLSVIFLITTDVDACEIDNLVMRRRDAGTDHLKIMDWANNELKPVLAKMIPNDEVVHLVVLHVIGQEKARLESGTY